MREIMHRALDIARSAGAAYADMRIVEERINRIQVERRAVKHIEDFDTRGYGVRVLLNGSWGFAASSLFEEEKIADTVKLAVETARASAALQSDAPSEMAPEQTHVDTQIGICEIDPFAVPNSEKAELLLEACDTMLSVPGIVLAFGHLVFSRLHRIIANTDGSYLDLTNTFAFPHLKACGVDRDEAQDRGYMASAQQGGYEIVKWADLSGNARRWAEEAMMKTRADECPSGTYDLVLDPYNLALTIHESVGHPTELDRILGWEANMAGRSFIKPTDIGSLRYGSDLVSFSVDNTMPRGIGSWFYDDDGVPMQSFPIVKNGILAGLSTTRETAALLGWKHSKGCCRAAGFRNIPLNRIPNLYLESGPDSVTPDDLISSIDRGIYIEGRGSFSIDQMRNNFQFGGDMFWLIEGGKLTKPLKKVTYHAQTREFWGKCDGIAGPDYWRPTGIWNCGKGEPSQAMRMTHGASHSRFRDISIGGARS